MSAMLSKLNLASAVVLDPLAAAAILATRGEWSELAQRVASFVRQSHDGTWPVVGTAVTFASLGLSPEDFPTMKNGKNETVPDFRGITLAARAYGLNVRRTVDDFRAFYVPADPEALIAKVADQRKRAAAKSAAKRKSATK